MKEIPWREWASDCGKSIKSQIYYSLEFVVSLSFLNWARIQSATIGDVKCKMISVWNKEKKTFMMTSLCRQNHSLCNRFYNMRNIYVKKHENIMCLLDCGTVSSRLQSAKIQKTFTFHVTIWGEFESETSLESL